MVADDAIWWKQIPLAAGVVWHNIDSWQEPTYMVTTDQRVYFRGLLKRTAGAIPEGRHQPKRLWHARWVSAAHASASGCLPL